MRVVHLLASPFLGGPERQVLGLARASVGECRTAFLSFAERGLARPFLERARADGFEAVELRENFPRLRRAVSEVESHLRQFDADLLCTSGYKPDLIGWRAARRCGIPVLAIAHGWTGVTLKVRFYEFLDAQVMRRVDGVACVSQAMADRVHRAGVAPDRIHVIRNAIDPTPFDSPGPNARRDVEAFFSPTPRHVVGAAGRLSPEKGVDVLVKAATIVCQKRDDVGFVVFGDGPLKASLTEAIRVRGLIHRVILAGFRADVEHLLPGLDLFVLSSRTEGLPVAVLEAQAARVAVVATAVGGTPEVVADGETGLLVPPNQPEELAHEIEQLLNNDQRRVQMGQNGARRVRQEFTFSSQAARYLQLFARLTAERRGHVAV